MKKINACIISFIYIIFMLTGCKNQLDSLLPVAEASNSQDYSNVSFSIIDGMNSSRTAKPNFEWDEYNYELVIIGNYDSSKSDGEQAANTSRIEKKAFSYFEVGTKQLPKGNYKFVLTGFTGDSAIIRGSSIITLTEDTQAVPFKMYPVTDQFGSVKVTLTFPADGVITKVLSGKGTSTQTAATDECLIHLYSDVESGKDMNLVEIEYGNIPSATEFYVTIKCFDSNNTLVFDHAVSVYSMGGKTSVDSIKLTENDYYRNPVSITIKKDGSGWENSPDKIYLIDKTSAPEKVYEISGSNGDYTGYIPEGEYEIVIPGASGNVDTGLKYNSESKEITDSEGNEKIPNVVTVTLPSDKGLDFSPAENDSGVVGADNNVFIVPEGQDFKVDATLQDGYKKPDDGKITIGETEYTVENENTIKDISFNAGTCGESSVEIEKPEIITYSISYTTNGGTWASGVTPISAYTVETETFDLPKTGITKESCILGGWLLSGGQSISVVEKGSTGNLELSANWINGADVPYTQEVYLQKIDSDEYELFSTETKYVPENTTVSAYNEAITGFTFISGSSTSSTKITNGSSVVMKSYYTRNSYTITFNGNGGSWSDDTSTQNITQKYGTPVTDIIDSKGTPVRSDQNYTYEFTGWDKTVPSIMPATDTTLNAVWNKTEAIYTVRQYFEVISGTTTVEKDGKYYEKKTGYEDITRKGKIGAKASINLDAVAGFNRLPYTAPVITADGNAVLAIYYNRKEITLTFLGNEGKWGDDSSILRTGKYGTTVPSVTAPERQNYSFDGWDKTVPSSYPETNAVYSAKWVQTAAAYTVEYWEQNSDGALELNKTATGTGTIGVKPSLPTAAITAPEKTGFKTPEITTTEVTADGNAVQKIIYKRKEITYTFKLGGGSVAGSTADVTRTGLYGAAVPAVTSPSYKDTDGTTDKYVFKGWNTVGGDYLKTFGSENLTYNAVWYSLVSGIGENPLVNDISVEHVINGKTLTASLSVPYTGTWTYKWYVDGVEKGQSVSVTVENLSVKKHKVLVLATESGAENLPGLTFSYEFDVTIR